MIRATLFIFVASAFIFASVWLVERPGYVILTWEGWQVNTKVSVLIFITILFLVVFCFLYRIWFGLKRTPAAIIQARKRQKRSRGYKALTQGMVAVAAGDATEARRQAQKVNGLLGEPPLTKLLSAQAAQLNGDEESANSDSFSNELLDHPHYTRPENVDGMKVPDILLSGHHANINTWRHEQRESRTKKNRLDLWKLYQKNYRNEVKK